MARPEGVRLLELLYNRPLYAFFSALFPPNKTFPWKDLWVAEFYLLNVR